MQCAIAMISTPLLSTCISTFPIICDIHVTFGHNVRPRHCSRMYFEPLGNYAMSFRSFLTSYNLFRHFSTFLCYFQSLLAYIGLVSTLMDYLCIPHAIVYLSDVFLTFSDLSQSLFFFTLINVPMFWLFLIVDRFHWFQCYYTFGLWSLQIISYIRTLRRHFDPSDVIITYTLPTTPILKREILCTSLPRPRKTLYHFDSTQTVFPCFIRPCSLYIDLETLCSTLLYCVLLIILHFSLCFISFAPILLDLSLPTSDYVYKPPHSFTYPYPISIEPDITVFITHLPQELIYQDFCTFRSF